MVGVVGSSPIAPTKTLVLNELTGGHAPAVSVFLPRRPTWHGRRVAIGVTSLVAVMKTSGINAAITGHSVMLFTKDSGKYLPGACR